MPLSIFWVIVIAIVVVAINIYDTKLSTKVIISLGYKVRGIRGSEEHFLWLKS